MGACCAEMDIWEANSISTAYTPHPCQTNSYHSCEGDSCGGTYSSNRYAGDCDPDGCDFNSYRQGNKTFYGPGSSFTLDTTKKLTVVTQFLTSGGTLSEIKRFYVQNGKTIPNSASTISGTSGNSITSTYCSAQKVAFGDTDSFNNKGGMAQMSKALAAPMVLVMSLWDDVSCFPYSPFSTLSHFRPPPLLQFSFSSSLPKHQWPKQDVMETLTKPLTALRQHAVA
jgi:cellulose 1,4-beta-cellobiosidase